MSLSWPWRFVSLTPEEVERRRELLDLRGYYAQCSVLLAIMAVRTYQMNGLRREHSLQSTSRHLSNKPRSWWDSPPFQGWAETRQQYLISFIWLGWLLCLSAWSSGNDYLHLTKSLGHVALSQLPVQTLMAPASYISSRPTSPSFLSALTSIPQPSLTPYHRLFGRVILAPLLLGHALLYLSFFVQLPHPSYSSLLAKRIFDPDVQLGLGALSLVVSVLLFARPSGQKSRRLWRTGSIRSDRRVFYVVHVLLVSSLCLAAYSHVVHARVFVLQAMGGFVANAACSWMLLGT